MAETPLETPSDDYSEPVLPGGAASDYERYSVGEPVVPPRTPSFSARGIRASLAFAGMNPASAAKRSPLIEVRP